MPDRIKDDEDLKQLISAAGPIIIDEPVLVVHNVQTNGKKVQQYLLHLSTLDPLMQEPKLWGILLSDLCDHIADAYHRTTGRDVRDLRATIMKVMRDEDRFKQADPARGGQIGAMVLPKAN